MTILLRWARAHRNFVGGLASCPGLAFRAALTVRDRRQEPAFAYHHCSPPFTKGHSGKPPKEFTTASTSSLGILVATTKQYSPLVQLNNCTRSLSIRVHACPQIFVALVRRPGARTLSFLGCWNMQNSFPWPAKIKPIPSARAVRYRTTLSRTMPSGSQVGY